MHPLPESQSSAAVRSTFNKESSVSGNLPNEGPTFLATTEPTARQRRIAFCLLGASLVFFVAAAPFAKIQLPHVPAVVPICQTVFVTNALITAILLLGQFRILGYRSLLVLGCGYLFGACMGLAHTLSFPGLFSPSGLFLAGTQTTAWLYILWHGGFALAVVAYGVLKGPNREMEIAPVHPNVIMLRAIIAVLALATLLTVVATAGAHLLPPIMDGNKAAPMKVAGGAVTSLLGLVALGILWLQRHRSLLDLWILVMIWIWVFHIALEAVLNQGRFDLGWYAGRLYGLFAESLVLLTLLFENSVLYSRLVLSSAQERKRSKERLLASEARFEATFEQAAVGIALVGIDGRWLRVNRKLCEIVGYSEEELPRLSLHEITEADDLEGELEAMRRILARELDSVSVERRCHCKHGRTIWIHLTISLALRPDGTPDYFIFVIEDVQARKDAATALAEQEARYRVVIETAADGFWMADREGHILAVNDSYVRRSGYSRKELQSMSIAQIEAQASEREVHAHIERTMRTGGDLFETRHRAKDGEIWPVEVKSSYAQMNGLFFAFLRDLTGQKSLERQIIEISTAEQERIGRDIHDGVGQELTGISMLARGLQRHLEAADRTAEANTAGNIVEHIQSALDEARALAAGLAPVQIGPDGLTDALRSLTARIGSAMGIACRYRGSQNVQVEAEDTAIQLYRIAQEAVQNAVKHADAKHIDVSLERSSDHVVLTVSDDGRGIAQARKQHQGIGLRIMAYRADIIGGKLSVESAEGRGTRIHCKVPQHGSKGVILD